MGQDDPGQTNGPDTVNGRQRGRSQVGGENDPSILVHQETRHKLIPKGLPGPLLSHSLHVQTLAAVLLTATLCQLLVEHLSDNVDGRAAEAEKQQRAEDRSGNGNQVN